VVAPPLESRGAACDPFRFTSTASGTIGPPRRLPDMARVSGSTRVVLAALGGNLAVAVTKFIAFALTRSTAMLTEAIHSLVDTGDQLLLLVGQRRAEKPPDRSHPFGYGMEAYFWSFVVAMLIFLAGGAVSLWEGVERFAHPEPINRPWISFVVLGASAVFEGLSFREAYREYERTVADSGVGLYRFLKLSKDPSVFGTLLEDGAALAGLAIAALGVAASAVLGATWADGAASIAIGLLLIAVALFLANETRSLIAGEAASPATARRIEEAAKAAGRGVGVVEAATLQLGPRSILVSVTCKLPSPMTAPNWQASARAIRGACREADGRVIAVHFLPEDSRS
jgi:cation diffusion facilitator family transporter